MKRVLGYTLFLTGIYWPSLLFAQAYSADELKLSIIYGRQIRMASDKIERVSLKQIREQYSYSEKLSKLNQADYYLQIGKEENAVDLYHRVFQGFTDTDPADYNSTTINVFSTSKRKDKRFTYAERLLSRISKKEFSSDDWMILARTVNSLGIYYHQLGNLAVAEKLYLKSLSIRATHANKTSEHYVTSLHNLGVLRKDQGRYNAAEDILKYVVGYFAAKRSKSSYQYAISLNNQAMLYAEIGRTEQCKKLLNAIIDNAAELQFANTSIDILRIKTNNALLYLEIGNKEKAAKILTSLLSEYELTQRKKHPDLLQLKLYLGELILSQNSTNISLEYIDKLLTEIEKEYSLTSLHYADGLQLRASWHFMKEEYGEALHNYNEVAKIRFNELGKIHKEYLQVVNRQGLCYWRLEKYTDAFEKFKLASSSYLQVIDKFFFNMSEKEKFNFWQSTSLEIDVLYSFVAEEGDRLPEAVKFAYEVRMQTKGLLIHNANKVLYAIEANNNLELTNIYKEWIGLKKDLSNYYSMSQLALEAMKVDIDLLENIANELEKEINLSVAGLVAVSETTSFEQVAAAVKHKEAAIEIIRLNNSLNEKNQAAQYGAWIILNNKLTFQIINDAELLEDKMIKYYKNAVRLKREDNLSYKEFWQPIDTLTSDVEKIYISLDGVYNLINLNSLATEGNYLIDTLDIDIIPNTRVIGGAKNINSQNSKAILVGNPSFSASNIAPLPGTALEISKLNQLLTANGINTDEFTGKEATEEAIKESNNPRILHIATHGFFMGDNISSKNNVGAISLKSTNPLLKSGLLLAGAGETFNELVYEVKSDGKFTAYDGMNLNLLNTELVVLSACETGSGEVVNGEGVYGLSRAFSVAGSKHVIISLWKVDDEATTELMSSFYQNWLSGDPIKIAFRNAQKLVKLNYKHPYFWAAFIMLNNE